VRWALVTSERSRPGARSEAAKKQETKGQREAGGPGGGVDVAFPGHGRDYTGEMPEGKRISFAGGGGRKCLGSLG
jgi:hypothetical protein